MQEGTKVRFNTKYAYYLHGVHGGADRPVDKCIAASALATLVGIKIARALTLTLWSGIYMRNCCAHYELLGMLSRLGARPLEWANFGRMHMRVSCRTNEE